MLYKIVFKQYFVLLFPLFFFSFNPTDVDPVTIAPTVMESTPVNGATSVNVNTAISIQFTEKIVLLSTGQIRLNDQVVVASASTRTITISPITLKHNTTYTLVIPNNAVSDVAGNFTKEISISFVTTDSFSISPTLVTPNASAQAVKLYDFLKLNFGKKIISGTMAKHSTNITEAIWVHDNTGKWPAMTSFDYIDHTNPGQNWIQYEAPFTLGQDWWNNNGIIGLIWHWRDPLTKTGGFYTPSGGSPSTTFDVSKVSDPNSAEYKAMIEDIDTIARYL